MPEIGPSSIGDSGNAISGGPEQRRSGPPFDCADAVSLNEQTRPRDTDVRQEGRSMVRLFVKGGARMSEGSMFGVFSRDPCP